MTWSANAARNSASYRAIGAWAGAEEARAEHQRQEQAAEQAGPALLQPEPDELVKPGREAAPRAKAAS
ncbi:hypothetical protein ACU4GA_17700 [Methylobacterium oryzae CBMB20]